MKMLQFRHIFFFLFAILIPRGKEGSAMLELIITVLFIWLFFKGLGLLLRLSWGITKLVVSLLFTIALPLLGFCLFFAGGLIILLPLGLVALAFGLLKTAL
jgi:hypothetical protein